MCHYALNKANPIKAKNKMNNNATTYYDLKHKKKDDFLTSSMTTNVVVIFEVQTLETIIIIAHSITQNAFPSNYNGC
jgi:hypothetical protein